MSNQGTRNQIFFSGQNSSSSGLSGLGIVTNDGTGSASFGQGAGSLNKGSDNVFAGTNAGADNVSGSRNVVVGSQALGSASSSSDILAVGYYSFKSVPSVSLSIAIGNYTATDAVKLVQVVCQGYASCQQVSQATQCVCLGTFSGQTASTILDDCFVGDSTGQYAGGNACVYVGARAGRRAKGSYNVALGADSYASGGCFSSVLGYFAGTTATVSDSDVCLGAYTGSGVTGSVANTRNTIVGSCSFAKSQSAPYRQTIVVGSNVNYVGGNTAQCGNSIFLGNDLSVSERDTNTFVVCLDGQRIWQSNTAQAVCQVDTSLQGNVKIAGDGVFNNTAVSSLSSSGIIAGPVQASTLTASGATNLHDVSATSLSSSGNVSSVSLNVTGASSLQAVNATSIVASGNASLQNVAVKTLISSGNCVLQNVAVTTLTSIGNIVGPVQASTLSASGNASLQGVTATSLGTC